MEKILIGAMICFLFLIVGPFLLGDFMRSKLGFSIKKNLRRKKQKDICPLCKKSTLFHDKQSYALGTDLSGPTGSIECWACGVPLIGEQVQEVSRLAII